MDYVAQSASAHSNAEAPVIFDAVLHPYRSLSRRGFLLLMLLVALVGFAGGIAFVYLGAWPITGFGLLELALFYVMFELSLSQRPPVRAGKADRGQTLVVERHEVNGARSGAGGSRPIGCGWCSTSRRPMAASSLCRPTAGSSPSAVS
jgi:uncharacterized membrane protein